MRLPCEVVANRILPAVRALLAEELHEKGYSQQEIADRLDLTQPAVSQYLSDTRGAAVRRIASDEEAAEAVAELADAVVTEGPDDDLARHCHEVCQFIRGRELFPDPAPDMDH